MQALGLSFLFIIVAAAVSWFFAFFVPGERQGAIDGWHRDLSLIADTRRDRLDRRIRDGIDNVTFVSAFPTVHRLLAPGPSEEAPDLEAAHMRGILSDFRRNYRQRSVSVVDPSGRIRASGGGPAPGAEALVFAADVIRSGTPGVDLVREPDGETGLACAVPVTGDEAGAGRPPVRGAVLVVGDASTLLFDLLGRPMAATSSEALLVREDGKDVLFLSPLRFRPNPPLSFRLPLATASLAARAALSEKADSRAFADYRGASVFAAVRQLQSAPWGLVVKVDEDEALAAFRKDVLQRGVTWGALLAALCAAAVGFWRSLVTANEVKLARSEARLEKAAEKQIRDLNRLLRTITDVSQLIVKAPEEEPLLAEVCRILVRRAGYVTAWIGRADPETKRVDLVAHAGAGSALLKSLEVRCDDSPLGRGPVGTAIREGRSIVLSDAPLDPSLEPWKEHVKTIGVGAIAAIPLRRGGVVTAGLSVFAPEGASIDEENLALLEELAGDVSYALDVLDARAQANKNELELRNLRQAVEQTPATVLITDLEGRIEYVNPSFTQVTGYTAEEARGQNPRFLKSDRTPPERYKELWETILGGRTWSGEICNKRKDGTLFWEQVSISPVRDETGVTRHYVAVKADITGRKRAAEDLAKSEIYFRSLIENSLDVTAVLDPEGRLRYISPSVERILGYKPEELAGRPVFELVHKEDWADAEAKIRHAFTRGTRLEEGEFRIRHRDGSWRAVAAIGKLLPEETGLRGLIVNARDLTESKQLESQLRQAQKMEAVGRLAGGVAHDFNNLLTVIQGYGELLQASLAGDPEKRESLGEIVRAAERAAALTRQLLAFSRRQVLETRILDLGEVVADTEKMLRRLIGEDVQVAVVKPATLGRVKADPGQIEQVLLNLAVNSRDAMPGGGRLTVELADVDLDAPLTTSHDSIPPGRYVVITMSDTGCGMDAETLGHLFEPFFTTKDKGKGTGLGLATVFGIVKQSGGYVDVASGPGAGTTFRVYLPRSDAPTTSGVHARVSSRSGSETVLVVEDEAAVRNLVRAVLERKGYVVLAAPDGAAALELVDKYAGAIHVLLTDVVMPGMNGRDLAARVRASRPRVKVVFMSGYAADVPADFGAEGGPAFLPKPFNERTLTSKLREVLDTPSTETRSRAARSPGAE